MNDLQHQRIAELCQELRLSVVGNLYSGIAQGAAAKDASFADFLEDTLHRPGQIRPEQLEVHDPHQPLEVVALRRELLQALVDIEEP